MSRISKDFYGIIIVIVRHNKKGALNMFSKKDQVIHSKCAVISFFYERMELDSDSDDLVELLRLLNDLRDNSIEYGYQNNKKGE